MKLTNYIVEETHSKIIFFKIMADNSQIGHMNKQLTKNNNYILKLLSEFQMEWSQRT